MCPNVAAKWSGVHPRSSGHNELQPCSPTKYLTIVQMTMMNSTVKRCFAVLTWNVWVTVLIRDEQSKYIQISQAWYWCNFTVGDLCTSMQASGRCGSLIVCACSVPTPLYTFTVMYYDHLDKKLKELDYALKSTGSCWNSILLHIWEWLRASLCYSNGTVGEC